MVKALQTWGCLRSITPSSGISPSSLGTWIEHVCGLDHRGLRQYARSNGVGEIVRPRPHQDPPSIEQVRSRVGRLDLARDGRRQTRFGNSAQLARFTAPIAE